jgi:tripartite-type tricarboxylate transporter receptor subunit TctC
MNKISRRGAVGALGGATLWLAAPAARAEAFPSKPVRFLVPYSY